RPAEQDVADALPEINARLARAVTTEQREIFETSALDEYLLDAERDARRRAAAVVARDEPSLEAFLPKRGDGLMLSASDVDTYRICPLRYKFGRPKTPAQLKDDVQLSLYAVGASEAWSLQTAGQAYYYVLDGAKVPVDPDDVDRDWIRETVLEVADGILAQGFEPTPSYAA